MMYIHGKGEKGKRKKEKEEDITRSMLFYKRSYLVLFEV